MVVGLVVVVVSGGLIVVDVVEVVVDGGLMVVDAAGGLVVVGLIYGGRVVNVGLVPNVLGL